MLKRFLLVLVLLACTIGLCACGDSELYAEQEGNVYIQDDAGLLSVSEEESLRKEMQKLTKYGDVAFCTRPSDTSGKALIATEETYAADCFQSLIGGDTADGILLLIDMENRVIWLETHGNFEKKISKAKADSITDAVYSLASAEDYFRCAKKAFSKSESYMQGKFVFDKLKVVSNGILAILFSLLLNFFVLRMLNRKKEVEAKEFGYANKGQTKIFNSSIKTTSRKSMRVSPSSRGFSGGSFRGGGGGFHGGSRGGGGFHSHGGGHRF